jgi:hypothetical protein
MVPNYPTEPALRGQVAIAERVTVEKGQFDRLLCASGIRVTRRDTVIDMIDSDGASPGATELITWRVVPGREAEFEAWAHDMTAVATGYEGHLGAAWLRPDAAGGAYQVVVRFGHPSGRWRW